MSCMHAQEIAVKIALFTLLWIVFSEKGLAGITNTFSSAKMLLVPVISTL